ncbi:MAG: Crp/Fnr family transcriptional regulator [Gammaproteobacteria bacterium]|nr:Crp/Fnr family transcriptional regulator [Gammaproteobacteria bacterium]MBU6508724.1 Crp/Fnr family transcriptional regulator [Gammaproteobacteria bacterium]MDE1983030.1 Crp/Fnr family transcriptional regulator [Gammaproteobacteria bacterium]MDE2107615.1 Crp/Fnr family transcriptional regulator [Gammaproteobacteria bacterium]MDE2461762.1 Crp/Fnr family transcriptional regulator [Gammaproteobacteria bacterium]
MPLSDSALHTLEERFPTFARLPPALQRRVAAEAQYYAHPAGKVVFDEHAPCRGLPLILDGSLRVFQRGANGREVELYRVKRGESCLLSASCLLGKISYTATALAEQPLVMVLLPPATFLALLDESPEFRHYVFGEFGERLGTLMQVVEAVVFQRLDQRLAARLLARGEDALQVTHQALADELGSVREIVSRLLRSFEGRHWIELGRERIVIRDRAALARLAGSG